MQWINLLFFLRWMATSVLFTARTYVYWQNSSWTIRLSITMWSHFFFMCWHKMMWKAVTLLATSPRWGFRSRNLGFDLQESWQEACMGVCVCVCPSNSPRNELNLKVTLVSFCNAGRWFFSDQSAGGNSFCTVKTAIKSMGRNVKFGNPLKLR